MRTAPSRAGLALQLSCACLAEIMALIDTGCDTTLMDADIAELLGIDSTKCEKIAIGGVVGESVEGFIGKVLLSVEGFDDKFSLEVIFVKGMKIACLLGHNDFLKIYKARFEPKRKKFFLEKENS